MSAAFLANFLFWTGLAIGGIALAAFVDVSGGRWLGPMRATAERFSRFLPISFVGFALLMWRRADVYPWAQRPAGTVWFDPAFVLARDAAVLVLVYGSAFAYCRASRRARSAPNGRGRTGAVAVVFLLVYAVGFSIVAIDLIMSLEPRWTSTLFPAYVSAENVFAGAAALAASAAWSSDPASAAAPSRMRDMANLLVGLALFSAYLFWSQFLVIWYGNVTAEVGFVMARVSPSRAAGWAIVAMCWAAPSIVLVPQWGKRAGAVLIVSLVVLAGLWLERWLLVAPDLPQPRVLSAVVVTIAYAALFGASVHGWRPTA